MRRWVRGLAALCGAICVLTLAGGTPTATGATAVERSASGPVVDDLGPASLVTATTAADRIGDRIYTATAGVSPVVVGGYDPATERIEESYELPTGGGVWAIEHIGTDLYVGTYTPGDLYKIDTVTGQVAKVASMGSFIWALDVSPDGKIFAGTYPTAEVYEYDPATGQTTNHGVAMPGEQYVRSIAADESAIYAGIGTKAHLVRIDRATGARTDILPPAYADRTFVATLDLVGSTLVAGMSPTATMLIFDTADPSNPREVQVDNDNYITAITAEQETGDVYFGTRPSGTLYRYRTASESLDRLGVPYDGASFYRIFPESDVVRAELAGQVTTYDKASGEFGVVDLAEAGLPPTPELAMAIAAAEDYVLVSGKAGIQVHNLTAGTNRRISLPGEAKTMTPVGDRVHLGVYTLARLWTMRAGGADLRELTRVEHEQTRPTDAEYDPTTGKLLMTTEPDYGKYSGTLTIYDPRSRALDVYRGVVPDQSVQSVAAWSGTAYLGSHTRNSLGTEPIATDATLSAFDLSSRRVLWELTPVPGATAIVDLERHRARLYGTTNDGRLFEFDPSTKTVRAVVRIADRGQNELVSARGVLYGTDGKVLYRVDPQLSGPPVITTIIGGLDAQWYGGRPLLTVAPDARSLYTLRGRNLIRVHL